MRKITTVLLAGLVLTVCVTVFATNADAWGWRRAVVPVYAVGYCGPPVVAVCPPPVVYCAPVVRVRACPPCRPVRFGYWGCW
jgi:hypothetical protein